MNGSEIKQKIDEYCQKVYDDGPRKHLGASLIGHDCSRYLQYSFRWMFREQFSARMYRLFNRGHLEEKRLIEWLRGIGFIVYDVGTNGKQNRFSAINGHFGGSCDAIIQKSEGEEFELLELKTSNSKGFLELLKSSLKICKPVHWAQICVYGFQMELKKVVYMAVNKNDDDIYVETQDIDLQYGEQLTNKAEKIIIADALLPKLSENKSFWKCKFCPAFDVCHNEKMPNKNCRSCKYSRPVENAQWHCLQYNQIIPENFIPIGCDAWTQFS